MFATDHLRVEDCTDENHTGESRRLAVERWGEGEGMRAPALAPSKSSRMHVCSMWGDFVVE